jgi:hypothetical protein
MEKKKKKDMLVKILMKLAEKEQTKMPCLAMPAPHVPHTAPPTQAAIYAATSEAEEVPATQLSVASSAEEVPTMQMSVASGTRPSSAKGRY